MKGNKLKMEILVAGDLVPTKSNEEKFKSKAFINFFDDKFVDAWKKADYRVFNLECPLGENLKPIIKNGPNLIAPSETINGIKSLEPDLIFLSNNHILDYGVEGLENTEKILKKHNITYTGIIDNVKQENKTNYIEKGDIRIGFYNVCENEFSVATNNRKGANPLNEVKSYKEVKASKEKCDYLIVIYHGGKEQYRYPSPKLQEICRNFVDCGADIVITQHSHCIGCKEEYEGATIVYGQGNFIFDHHDNEYWNTSLIIKLIIHKNKIDVKYLPIEKYNTIIKLSNNNDILKNFNNRSKKITKKDFIEREYIKLAENNLNYYLSVMSKSNLYTKILNKLCNRRFFIKKYNKKDCSAILNILECEAHRELFIRGLKKKIYGK